MCDECGWRASIEYIDSIIAAAEGIPEKGKNFAASIIKTTQSLRDGIEDAEHVTEKQDAAINNRNQAVDRWFHPNAR